MKIHFISGELIANKNMIVCSDFTGTSNYPGVYIAGYKRETNLHDRD